MRLAQRGHRVTGVDISAYNLEAAAAQAAEFGVDVTWREADMRDTGLAGSSQDAVINMFTAFGYFDDEGNQRVLEEVARVLRPGGRFLIELINRDSLMRRFEPRRSGERRDGRMGIEEHEFDAVAATNTTKWEVTGADGERRSHSFTVRIYTLQELELRMSQAGLTVEEAWGGLDGSELTMDSRRLAVLARAE